MALTGQQGEVGFAQPREGIVRGGKQGEGPLLVEQVSQTSGFHQGQEDPATNQHQALDHTSVNEMTKIHHLWVESVCVIRM